MHKCLLVTELVHMICTQLQSMALGREIQEDDQHTPIQECRETLYNLALTCHAFKEAALDMLWFDLDSLYPLLRCLPVDIHARYDGAILIDRALEQADFEVFQKYACRVRSVGYRRRNPYISKDLVHILSNFPCAPGTALLPNLKVFVCDGDSDEIIPFFRFLVPPTLLHLHLSGSRWPQCKLSFVSFLHKHIPDLMEFSCVDAIPEAMHRISKYICNAKHLSSIDVGVPSAKAMNHLMNSATLRHLIISLPAHNVWDRVEGTFPSTVTHFALRAYRLDKAVEFLRTVKLSPMHVAIELSDVAPGSLVEPFFHQLTKSLDWDKLEELRYTITGVVSNPRITQYLYELESHSLTPLLRFKNLVTVRLENFRTPLMDDNMAKRIADAWPHLEELKIGTGQDWQTDTGLLRRSQLTLYGVGYVVQHCHKLKILGLVFDPTVECEMIPAHWSNSNVWRLDVGASPVDSPVAVAATLLFLLPSLREIWTKTPTNISSGIGLSPVEDKRAEKWTMVLEMVNVFASVKDVAKREARMEERGKMLKELAEKGLVFAFLRAKKVEPVKEEGEGDSEEEADKETRKA
ncbi:hypothetical protein BS17DRAFT_787721 [Gyrodon lividus]|nr:hypothetical protein BS17DRAFT_787721 [Gyrodon lividus]